MYRWLLPLLIALPLLGEIITSPTIESLIPKAEGNYWLVVDLDNTLFEGKEALGHADWFYDRYKKELEKGLTKAQAVEACYPLWIKTQAINHVQPVEERFVQWIRELQSQGVVVMGLTARQPAIQLSTERQLKELEIDLSLTAPKGSLKKCFCSPALYANGILYAHDLNDKGAVFSAFLNDNQLLPEKILFVDDRLHNVEDMEKTLHPRGIKVTGLHYTALAEREPVYQTALADFQLQKLNTLLSNDEALLLLHHQPDIHP